jgi:hypothetical protein
MHPEPLFRPQAHLGGKAVIQRLGHRDGVGVGDGVFDQQIEMLPIGLADPIHRHQQAIVFQCKLCRR